MKFPLAFLVSGLVFFSCSGDHESPKQENKQDSVVSVAAVPEVEPQDAELVNLPSPLRIANSLKRSGIKLIESSLNDRSLVKNYNSTFSKSLNLGVYSADMAYCLLNKQYSLSKDYLKTCRELGDGLGLESAFASNNLAQRFEKNLGKEDSLLKIVTELQQQTDEILESNKSAHISVLIFTGAWVETMNSAAEAIKKGEKKVIATLLEQLSFSESVMAALKQESKNESNIDVLLNKVNELNQTFKALGFDVKNETDEIDYSTVKIEDEKVNALCKQINELRNNIIKG